MPATGGQSGLPGRAEMRVMVVTIFLWLAGCAVDQKVPRWLSTMPGSTQEICAIGISGPTYYPEHARSRSHASAMAELARAVEVRVKTDLLIRSEGDARGVDVRLNETSDFGSDVLLKQAQVREQWVQSGKDIRHGELGTVYTLVCMPAMQ